MALLLFKVKKGSFGAKDDYEQKLICRNEKNRFEASF